MTPKKISLIVIAVVLGGLVCWQWSKPISVDFSGYAAGPERKQAFVEYFQPLIEQENRQISAQRSKLLSVRQSGSDSRWLYALAEQYRLKNFNPKDNGQWRELLSRVDTVPVSLALAQAANESGWGTSRFSREGNNFFGQWCFEKGCGLVPKSRNAGASHEVAAFRSPRESVARYLLNLNSHNTYAPLREVRARLRSEQQPVSGAALAEGLSGYSERGAAYIDELQAMIRHNNWARLDVSHSEEI